jgi:hypothetical protein
LKIFKSKLLAAFFLTFLLFNELEGQTSIQNVSKRDENNLSIVVTRGSEFLFADPGNSQQTIFGPVFNQGILTNGEFSLGLKRVFPGNFSIKADLSYSHYTGTDSIVNLKDITEKHTFDFRLRGYSFKSDVLQLKIRAEYAFYIGDEYSLYRTSAIYPFIGIGLLSSNATLTRSVPTFNDDGKYKYLNSVVSPVIPFGVGYQYDLDPNFSVGAEIKYEYVFSDYLDGFRPPNPRSNNNDFIFGISLVLTYKIHQYSRSTYY